MHAANSGAAQTKSTAGIVERVHRAATAHPTALAVAAPGGTLTYQQLWDRALGLAQRIRDTGLSRGDPVALCLSRSAELVVGALGILAAGGCYVALDPQYPEDRLRYMFADSGAKIVVATRDVAARLGAPHSIEPTAEPASSPATPVEARPHDPAYIVYTSGSTGQPKGVVLEHAGLLNLVEWHQNTFSITESDRGTQVVSPGFDAAAWEIWPCLTAGASLHIPRDELRTDPIGLRDWVLSERVTTTFLPTPLCEALLELDWPTTAPLRAMLTGGDVLHRRPRTDLPFVLVNNYGPSEATVVATSGICPHSARRSPGCG